jgi:5-methyltetrahydrofolate corrinoid/iron sulfur protein methyltransferase
MKIAGDGLVIIGENFNATRKIRITSPKVVTQGDKVGIGYTDLDGNKRVLDVTSVIPTDPNKRQGFPIPHIGEACRQKDLNYIRWAIKNQELHGAHIIDLCVDEMSVYPQERYEWMAWLVKTAQGITDSILAIDSSDPETIRAGLEAHDSKKGRPAINSVNLEAGRQVLVDMAKERNAILFANASGQNGMPQNAEQRVENLEGCMAMMDKGGIPMDDRYLDPLVFPIGAGPDFGRHYIDAVRTVRERYPEVHIFGGHSNVSFGLPERKMLNFTFVALSVLAGCDSLMIDPIMNPPKEFNDFMFAANALTGKDEYSVKYLKYTRANIAAAKKAAAAALAA